MGYSKDLGTAEMAGICPITGFPADSTGQLLDPISDRTGEPLELIEGSELANLTNPYGHLHFAAGSGDDFTCFDYATINAGPKGEFIILDATYNTETGNSIFNTGYEIMPINTEAEKRKALAEAFGMVDQAMSIDEVQHTIRGWNQRPEYFARAVAVCLFPRRFKRMRSCGHLENFVTDRMKRYGGTRIDRVIDSILTGPAA